METVFVSVLSDPDCAGPAAYKVSIIGRAVDPDNILDALVGCVDTNATELFGDKYIGDDTTGVLPAGSVYRSAVLDNKITMWLMESKPTAGWMTTYDRLEPKCLGWFTYATSTPFYSALQTQVGQLTATLADVTATNESTQLELAAARDVLNDTTCEHSGVSIMLDEANQTIAKLTVELSSALDTANDYFSSILHLNAQVTALRAMARKQSIQDLDVRSASAGITRQCLSDGILEETVEEIPAPETFVRRVTPLTFGMDSVLVELRERFGGGTA